jgi:hypothetical protein
MNSMERGCPVAGVAALLLLLSACSATGPARPGDGQPTAAFSTRGLEDGQRQDAHGNDRPPARVRRDAYGRPIHFREIRLDRHGKAHCVGDDCPAGDKGRSREGDREGNS